MALQKAASAAIRTHRCASVGAARTATSGSGGSAPRAPYLSVLRLPLRFGFVGRRRHRADFYAYDAKTGDILWKFNTGAGWSAASIDVLEQPLQRVCAIGYRFRDGRSQDLAVRSRIDDGLDVSQVLRAARNELHEDNGVNGRNRNAVTHGGTVQTVLYDTQRFGQRDLIHLNPVELHDGHSHRHKPGRVGLESLVAHQEIDVFGGARPTAIGVCPERPDERMPNPGVSEHPGNLSHGTLVTGNRPQRLLQVWLAARGHATLPPDGNLGFQNTGTPTSTSTERRPP